jgi:hypothetical protein
MFAPCKKYANNFNNSQKIEKEFFQLLSTFKPHPHFSAPLKILKNISSAMKKYIHAWIYISPISHHMLYVEDQHLLQKTKNQCVNIDSI